MRPGRTIAVMVALVLSAGCGTDAPAAQGPPDGPQHRGRFVTVCGPSHHAADDPIVSPGEPGAAHLHEFFGNVAIDAHSTTDAVAGAETTCATKADRAAYWVPALLDGDGERVPPDGADVYYRAGRGVDPGDVEPYPHGLRMIAGDAGAEETQPTGITGWSCTDNPVRSASVPDCAGELRLRVTFQDCWDGDALDSEDHGSHVAYSGPDGCPTSHPVAVPQLELVVRYPHTGDPDGLRLSSGEPATAHADFWNLWEPGALAREVSSCIHRDVVCGDTRS